jgi:hypothetical protein
MGGKRKADQHWGAIQGQARRDASRSRSQVLLGRRDDDLIQPAAHQRRSDCPTGDSFDLLCDATGDPLESKAFRPPVVAIIIRPPRPPGILKVRRTCKHEHQYGIHSFPGHSATRKKHPHNSDKPPPTPTPTPTHPGENRQRLGRWSKDNGCASSRPSAASYAPATVSATDRPRAKTPATSREGGCAVMFLRPFTWVFAASRCSERRGCC